MNDLRRARALIKETQDAPAAELPGRLPAVFDMLLDLVERVDDLEGTVDDLKYDIRELEEENRRLVSAAATDVCVRKIHGVWRSLKYGDGCDQEEVLEALRTALLLLDEDADV